MIVPNILTVDWEDWYQGNPNIAYVRAVEFESRIAKETRILLSLLGRYKIKATFFMLGHLVEKYPDLVKSIADSGHEVASHGYSHQQLYYLTPSEFKEELRKTSSAIKKATGKQVVGFRASNWSINKSTWWVLKVLKEEGYLYDSSIFPTKNYSYGMPDAPRFAFRHNNGVWEIPPATIEILGMKVPCCGGFYLRLWPSWFSYWSMKRINREKHPVVIHIHPWELDSEQPRYLPIPLVVNLLHYWNIKSTEEKLRQLVKNGKFITMREYVEQLKKGDEKS